MESALAWQRMFQMWPQGMPRKGLVVTSYQENIVFVNFLIADGLLALERDRPDTTGARKVIVAFSAILAVKQQDTDPFENMKQLNFA